MSSSEGNLKRELLDCSERNPPLCSVCGKGFTEKGHVNRYCLIHKGIKEHVCKICGKAFIQKDDLKEHLLTHSDTIARECSVCGKTFTRKESLKLHYLIHKGIKDHVCNYCGKAFTQKGSLNKHYLIHRGIKKHTCDICGKTFTEKGSLNKHTLIHKGIKDYVCTVCGKAFTLKGTLEQHTLVHLRQNKRFTEPLLTFEDSKPMKCNDPEKCHLDKDLFIGHISKLEPVQSSSNKHDVNSDVISEGKYQRKVDQTQKEYLNQKSLKNVKQEENFDGTIIKEEHAVYFILDDIKEENCDLTILHNH